jgi:hypothetical protein
MSCCCGWHHGSWCHGPPPEYYRRPTAYQRRPAEDLEDQIGELESELARVRRLLEEMKEARTSG